jgi:DNA mismatch repair ATPase MutS
MSLITDKQTLDDLAIFPGKGRDSIYNVFNKTRTLGGARLLEQFFRYPLSDEAAINKRSGIILSLQEVELTYPIPAEYVDLAENYLSNGDSRNRLSAENDNLHQRFRNFIGTNTEEKLLMKGIDSIIKIVHATRQFLGLLSTDRPDGFLTNFSTLEELMASEPFQELSLFQPGQSFSFSQLAELDYLLRFENPHHLKNLLEALYELDVYIAIANVAANRGLAYAVTVPKGDNHLDLNKVFHPFLKAPVPNSFVIGQDKNVVFLTGANMAGKSTFLKSVGIALYLAHMGFPVPAGSMRFSVMDGILTTINLSDDVSIGYSHFYAEVMRVKKMAELVTRKKHVFIIFDELFRGTNVKDAYDATVAVTNAMTSISNAIFMVSTHIMEAGEKLNQEQSSINFYFLPTKMKGNQPVYTYTLEEGISDERHGMVIIRNEGILEMLANGVPNFEHDGIFDR